MSDNSTNLDDLLREATFAVTTSWSLLAKRRTKTMKRVDRRPRHPGLRRSRPVYNPMREDRLARLHRRHWAGWPKQP